MKQTAVVFFLGVCLIVLGGCETLRFAPGEQQKQNAYLHNRTAAAAARLAEAEKASVKVQQLTQLSQLQSRALSRYYGMPRQVPAAETADELLAESNFELARASLAESEKRPDGWQAADYLFEVSIGIATLFGGVYGGRAVGFLRSAQAKSKALREIITANEKFKQQRPEYAEVFKQAHEGQSGQTRQLVSQIKHPA